MLSNGSIAPCSGKGFISDRALIFKYESNGSNGRSRRRIGRSMVELLKKADVRCPIRARKQSREAESGPGLKGGPYSTGVLMWKY